MSTEEVVLAAHDRTPALSLERIDRELSNRGEAALAVLRRLLPESEGHRARVILRNLAPWGAQLTVDDLAHVLSKLSDPQPSTRVAAIEALAEADAKDVRVSDALLPLLDDPGMAVRTASASRLYDRGRQDRLVEVLTAESSPQRGRLAAAGALAVEALAGRTDGEPEAVPDARSLRLIMLRVSENTLDPELAKELVKTWLPALKRASR